MKQEQLDRYRSKVNFQYMTNKELISAFGKKYYIRELDINKYPILSSNYIKEVLKPRADTSAVVYILEKDERSQHFYDAFREEDFEPFSEIYIMFGNMDYFESNSAEVYTELFFLKGIKKEDYDKGEEKAREYVDMLENPG